MLDLSRGELVARRASLAVARKAIDDAIAALDTALQNKPPSKPAVRTPRPMVIVTSKPPRRERSEPMPERPDRAERKRVDKKANEHTVNLIIERGERGTTALHLVRVFGINRKAAQNRLNRLAITGLIIRNARGVYFPAPPHEVAHAA